MGAHMTIIPHWRITRMIHPKINYRAVVIITIVLSVIGLIVSPISAATATALSGDPSMIPAGISAPHHAFNSTQQAERLQNVLANLTRQGVDVSQAEADLAAGNVTAAAGWLMTYHKDHPELAMYGPRMHAFNITQRHAFSSTKPHVVNATQQAARLQTVFTTLGQKGVDVTQALADLATGNLGAAMKDLLAISKAHPGLVPGFTGQHAFNSTQMTARIQTEITKLSGQGVDVSQVQEDLASGNMTAAMQWMAAYHKAYPVPAGNGTASPTGNSNQWQKEGSFRPHNGDPGNGTAWHPGFPAHAHGA
jgi:multidrug efflux pump subunit AcrB